MTEVEPELTYVGTKLEKAQAERLRKLAKLNKRSVAMEIAFVLENHIKRNEAKING